MQKIVIINQGGRRYLFAVPKNGYVDKGDRVLVDTRYGEREGVAASNDFYCSGEEFDAFVTLTGATLPLRYVLGKLNREIFEPDEVPTEEPKKTKLVFSKEKYLEKLDLSGLSELPAKAISCAVDFAVTSQNDEGREVRLFGDGKYHLVKDDGSMGEKAEREWCEEVPC